MSKLNEISVREQDGKLVSISDCRKETDRFIAMTAKVYAQECAEAGITCDMTDIHADITHRNYFDDFKNSIITDLAGMTKCDYFCDYNNDFADAPLFVHIVNGKNKDIFEEYASKIGIEIY